MIRYLLKFDTIIDQEICRNCTKNNNKFEHLP